MNISARIARSPGYRYLTWGYTLAFWSKERMGRISELSLNSQKVQENNIPKLHTHSEALRISKLVDINLSFQALVCELLSRLPLSSGKVHPLIFPWFEHSTVFSTVQHCSWASFFSLLALSHSSSAVLSHCSFSYFLWHDIIKNRLWEERSGH